ncbi:TlpA family protein disulfide reductase [Azospira restricta]|uniref:TlpA family protein disulfide reductase n=1 Tax=Azospira restricta TaxID=404405 RepID=A0A974PYR3_9RHOO|nr:TlpA disulfide reductase family protein [Azospira restricta]QRJ63591.1 TlpA family protein disulfide reductase [Azospira restricta]
MNEKKAMALLGFTSMLTLATVGYLGYRMYTLSQMPSQEQLAQQARASRQVSGEAAQAGADALMAMTLPDLKGVPQALAQWNGKIRVINYWATWCPPCVEEMPMLSRLAERFAAEGVQFVGIGLDETEKMQAFVQKTPVAYPLLAAGTNPGGSPALTVKGMPYTIVLGRDGKVAFSLYGAVREEELDPLLRRLVAAR